MEVILLEKIGKLGTIGDKAIVKSGFGRNYLIPQGKAVFATEANIAAFELRRAELEANAAAVLAEAEKRAAALAAIGSVTITAVAGDEGKLFGSVGVRELETAIAEAGGDINKSEINLPDGPIRFIGEFSVECQLHVDVIQNFTVVVEAE
jgi:large subunit ribosomal protein L9